MCAVVTVSKVYAAGPARTATTPSAAIASAVFRDAFERPVTINTAAARPATSTTVRKLGTKLDERLSKTKAQSAVVATAPASARRAIDSERCCHRYTAPMPTRAPIAGARATV